MKDELIETFTEEEVEEYGDLIGKYLNRLQKSKYRDIIILQILLRIVLKLNLATK